MRCHGSRRCSPTTHKKTPRRQKVGGGLEASLPGTLSHNERDVRFTPGSGIRGGFGFRSRGGVFVARTFDRFLVVLFVVLFVMLFHDDTAVASGATGRFAARSRFTARGGITAGGGLATGSRGRGATGRGGRGAAAGVPGAEPREQAATTAAAAVCVQPREEAATAVRNAGTVRDTAAIGHAHTASHTGATAGVEPRQESAAAVRDTAATAGVHLGEQSAATMSSFGLFGRHQRRTDQQCKRGDSSHQIPSHRSLPK